MEAGDRNEYIELSSHDEMSDLDSLSLSLDNAQIDGKSNTDASDWYTDRGCQI